MPGTAGLAKMYNGIALSRDKRTLVSHRCLHPTVFHAICYYVGWPAVLALNRLTWSLPPHKMAADSVGRKILFFNREEGGQLRFKDEIKLPFHPDNIEPSPVSEELYTVGVTTLQEASIVLCGYLQVVQFANIT